MERQHYYITKQEVHIPGVSVLFLENNFYKCHWNAKDSTNNTYKGAVLYSKLVFPKDYPV